jgi:hypothetical protein
MSVIKVILFAIPALRILLHVSDDESPTAQL